MRTNTCHFARVKAPWGFTFIPLFIAVATAPIFSAMAYSLYQNSLIKREVPPAQAGLLARILGFVNRYLPPMLNFLVRGAGGDPADMCFH